MRQATLAPNWRNEVTLRSLELTFGFEPMRFIHQVAPRPLMVIGAEFDTLMPIHASQEAFARAGEPKQFGLASEKWRGFLELKGNRNAEAEEFYQRI
jgi:hypothetical protein